MSNQETNREDDAPLTGAPVGSAPTMRLRASATIADRTDP